MNTEHFVGDSNGWSTLVQSRSTGRNVDVIKGIVSKSKEAFNEIGSQLKVK